MLGHPQYQSRQQSDMPLFDTPGQAPRSSVGNAKHPQPPMWSNHIEDCE